MKKITDKYPVLLKYILAILLFGLSLVISGLINKGVIKEYFPYASAICLLLATWFLYKIDMKSLEDIGLNLKLKSLLFLPFGLLIGSIAFLIAKYLRAIYLGEEIHASTSVNYKSIIYGIYIILPTVAVEEFLFRGYLFKKTIEISSVTKANIIFSVLFTLVHVLDSGVINNPPMIVFLVFAIPVGHLLFATALLKSKSLLFAIGIHLGNNWATNHLITVNNNGESFLYITNSGVFETWYSFILFIILWNSFFLIITLIIWKWNYFINFKRF